MGSARDTSLVARVGEGPLLIDGGLSTALEERGHVLADPLWTARMLLEAPGEVTAAHAGFVTAGAEIVITASYQVSAQGFVAAGLSEGDSRAALLASVSAARAAGPRFVAASVGPYGAILADGSEYRGDYGLSVDELAAFHAPRIGVLVSARPDALAIETIPDLDEAQALARVIGSLPSPVPAWVSFSCGPDGRLHSGHDVAEAAAAVADAPGVFAVGVNCTAPADVGPALRRIRTVTDLPLVVYPNAGREWDGERHEWCGEGSAVDEQLLNEWLELGVGLIGGCCGFGHDAIARLRSQI